MIVDFSIANYGPFRERATLSMVPSAMTDRADAIAPTPAVRSGLLKAAAVFGANASGKSYIFEALADLREVVSSARPDGTEIPGYKPFRLSRDTLGSPVEFRIRMEIGGVLYDYGISFLGDRIVSERLSHSPRGRTVPVFSRGGGDERMEPAIAERLTPPSSYLFVAAGYNDDICNTVLKAILSIHVISQPSDGSVQESYYAAARDPEIRSMMESALDAADLGIKGFVGEERTVHVPGKERSRKYLDLRFVHSYEVADEDLLSFPYDIESNGTVEMFALMGPIADALKNGRTVAIDEFGSDLHPMLTRWIVNLFNGKENDTGAQLLVNTHDIGLMDIDGFLRRDEIWFTDKDRRSGASVLFSLSDINGVKKGSNVRKDYLMGRFDGIPAVIGVRRL